MAGGTPIVGQRAGYAARHLPDRPKATATCGCQAGSDMLKALALCADGALTGRATLYGLCAYCEARTHKALELIEAEMRNDMRRSA